MNLAHLRHIATRYAMLAAKTFGLTPSEAKLASVIGRGALPMLPPAS